MPNFYNASEMGTVAELPVGMRRLLLCECLLETSGHLLKLLPRGGQRNATTIAGVLYTDAALPIDHSAVLSRQAFGALTATLRRRRKHVNTDHLPPNLRVFERLRLEVDDALAGDALELLNLREEPALELAAEGGGVAGGGHGCNPWEGASLAEWDLFGSAGSFVYRTAPNFEGGCNMLEVETPDGKGLKFDSIAAARDWTQEEVGAFKWMDGNVHDLRVDRLLQRRQKLFDLRDQLAGLADTENVKEAKRHLERVYGMNSDTPRSNSVEGRYLCFLATSNAHVANATAALLLGDVKPEQHQQVSIFRPAAAALAALKFGVPGLDSNLHQIRIDGERMNASLADLRKQAEAQINDYEAQADAKVYEWKTRFEALRETSETSFAGIIETAQNDYAKLKDFFERELSLKAPVFYWRTVAENARKWARVWGIVFGGELLILGVALGSSVSGIKSFLADTQRESVAIIIAVAISTLVFWALRMSARIFLSNYHRATDAAERETMVATFLALRREEHIGADHLALVLAPLFRPGTTGLVKDDAAPEFGPAALLTKDRRS